MLTVQLIGNLGANAEKRTADGRDYITMRIAINDKVTNQSTGEITETTTWVSVSYAPKLFGILPYLTRGTKVYVQGNFRTKIYKTNDGHSHVGIDVYARQVELCSAKEQQPQQQQQQQQPQANTWQDNTPY